MLANPKWEAFCLHYAKTGNASEAYRQAGYETKNERSIYSNCNRLLKNDDIKARLAEGFTFDDFKTVIDKKSSEWIGTEFEKFLRPETLFGTKFESYLNAPTKQKLSKNSSFDTDEFFNAAVRRSMNLTPREALEREAASRMGRNDSVTVSDDPELKRRADALREQLGG